MFKYNKIIRTVAHATIHTSAVVTECGHGQKREHEFKRKNVEMKKKAKRQHKIIGVRQSKWVDHWLLQKPIVVYIIFAYVCVTVLLC